MCDGGGKLYERGVILKTFRLLWNSELRDETYLEKDFITNEGDKLHRHEHVVEDSVVNRM